MRRADLFLLACFAAVSRLFLVKSHVRETDQMHSPIRAIAAFCLMLVTSATALAQNGDALRLQLVRIMDPTGFEKPLTAATSVIPADWTAKGGVIWNATGTCTLGQTVDWIATSGDGKAFIQLMPNPGWQFNSLGVPASQDCLNAAFKSADEYARSFVSQLPGGKVTAIERDPQTTAALSQYPFRYESKGDPYARSWWDAASVSFDYRQDGVPYSGVVILFTTHSYNLSGHSYGYGAPLETGFGLAMSRIVMAAPKERAEAYLPAFYVFLKNFQSDPEWSERMARHNARLASDNMKASANVSNIISQTYSDISDMSMKGWSDRNASSDRMQANTVEVIKGVETYGADTPTGQIELPNQYDRAFQLNDGSFVVTNNVMFEPYRDTGLDGTELKTVP